MATKLKERQSLNGTAELLTTPREAVTIAPPKMDTVAIRIRGDAPLCQLRFGEKQMNQMREKQLLGSQSTKGKKREPKDFDALYRQAAYRTKDWFGINAAAFRNAMIAVCRVVGYKMTMAKLCIFIVADGYDEIDSTPLVKITKGEPRKVEHPLPNANGGRDIRVRAMWDAGWECIVRVKFDSEQFAITDIVNLMARVGIQNGIGEGRSFGKVGHGCGWGSFEIVTDE